MVYQVKDLSPEQRNAAEILLGHRVSESEAVRIRNFAPAAILPASLSPEERIDAFHRLIHRLTERFGATMHPPVSEPEESDAVTEAARSSRPNYKPAR